MGTGRLLEREVFFFCKQKTEYEIRLSVVGSEMGKRDRLGKALSGVAVWVEQLRRTPVAARGAAHAPVCLLYPPDAADESTGLARDGHPTCKTKHVHQTN